jgi:hypothetical protein
MSVPLGDRAVDRFGNKLFIQPPMQSPLEPCCFLIGLVGDRQGDRGDDVGDVGIELLLHTASHNEPGTMIKLYKIRL